MALCMVHQKMRGVNYLSESPPGSGIYRCTPGNECKGGLGGGQGGGAAGGQPTIMNNMGGGGGGALHFVGGAGPAAGGGFNFGALGAPMNVAAGGNNNMMRTTAHWSNGGGGASVTGSTISTFLSQQTSLAGGMPGGAGMVVHAAPMAQMMPMAAPAAMGANGNAGNITVVCHLHNKPRKANVCAQVQTVNGVVWECTPTTRCRGSAAGGAAGPTTTTAAAPMAISGGGGALVFSSSPPAPVANPAMANTPFNRLVSAAGMSRSVPVAAPAAPAVSYNLGGGGGGITFSANPATPPMAYGVWTQSSTGVDLLALNNALGGGMAQAAAVPPPMGGGGGGGRGYGRGRGGGGGNGNNLGQMMGASGVTMTVTCSLHNKRRTVSNVQEVGPGVYRCRPDAPCKTAEGGAGEDADTVMCATHGRQRLINLLQLDEATGTYRCRPGSECKISTQQQPSQ